MTFDATVRREVEKRISRTFLALAAHIRECPDCEATAGSVPELPPHCDIGVSLYDAWRTATRAMNLATQEPRPARWAR